MTSENITDNKIIVFVTYPESVDMDNLPSIVERVIGLALRDDSADEWQYRNTRIFDGRKLSGRVFWASWADFQFISPLLPSLGIEVVGAWDFNYSKTVDENDNEIITGQVYVPMSSELYNNFQADINIAEIDEKAIYEKAPLVDETSEVIDGAAKYKF